MNKEIPHGASQEVIVILASQEPVAEEEGLTLTSLSEARRHEKRGTTELQGKLPPGAEAIATSMSHQWKNTT
jgi:hypothetical protein